VRLLLRWMANALAFYLALYLMDSLIAPRFYVGAVWMAVILALVLGILNGLVRPLHRVRTKPQRALVVTAVTVVVNALILQIFMWMGAPLSSTGLHWLLITAIFLTLLGAVINWLIGFKPEKEPNVITRDLRTSRSARERERERERERGL